MPEDSARLIRALRRAASRLDRIKSELELLTPGEISVEQWLEVRARIGVSLDQFDESAGQIDRSLGLPSAHSRLLNYLRLRVGETVTMSELSGVAGIHEWARRIRELREDGWPINTSVTRVDLRVGEYVLEADGRDPDLARTWSAAKRNRRLRTAGGVLPPKQRVLAFLTEISPQPADPEQLAHVAGSLGESQRVLQELKCDGVPIVSSDDDASVPVGRLRLVVARS